MRILLVNDYKEKIGGAEAYVWSLKDELTKRGYKVRVFGSDITKDEYNKQHSSATVGKLLKRIFNFSSLLEFRKLIQEFKPDIIHVHNIFYEMSPSILLAVHDIPVIMTVHDSQIVNAVSILSARTGKECKKRTCGGCMNCVGLKGMVYESIKRKVHKKFLKRISLYISPSKYMGDLIKEAGLKPVEVIPNGIHLLKYSKIANYNRLLYVGRLSKDKGIEYLLRAMPAIISQLPEVQLHLVGDGYDTKYFEGLTKELDIEKYVYFVGKVDKEMIENYYKDSTLVIVPSIYRDNFPTVCLEAMSAGRPIVGTKVGGIPELVHDNKNGFLVNERDSRDLSLVTMKLLSLKKEINTFGQIAFTKAKKYHITSHIDKLVRVYETFSNEEKK